MPKLIACAIRDRQVDAFNRPFFVPARGLAIRSFTDEVNRDAKDNPMFNHPADFELFEVGSYDEETAQFETLSPPKSLAVASNVLVPKEA